MPLFDNLKLAQSRFIPTYAGTPLEEIERSANVLQDRYYQNLANQNQVELALEQQPYLPGDEPIRGVLRDDLQAAIESIANTGGDYENATQRVFNLSQAYITDPRRLQAERNYQAVQQEIELENKMRAQGQTPLRSRRRENFSTVNPTTGELQLFESDLQPQLDYDKRRQTLFDNIRADSGPLTLRNLFPEEKQALKGYLKTGQWTGVSKGKIQRYLNEAFNRYQTTDEYRQQKYFGESDENILNQLMSTGLERVFGQTRENLVRDLTFDKEGTAMGNVPYAYTRDGAVQLNQRFPDPDDFKVRQRTEVDPTRVPLGQVPGLPQPFVESYRGPKRDMKPEEQQTFKLITDQLVGANASDEEKAKAYDNYVEKYGQKNVAPDVILSDYLRQGEEGRSTREDASKDANSTYRHRVFYDIEEGELVRGNDPDFWEDHLDGKEDQIEVTGFYDSKNNFPTITGNPNFGVGMAVRIKGTNKQYIMTRFSSEYENDPVIHQEMMLNQLYDNSSKLPNLWAPTILNNPTIKGGPIPVEVKQNIAEGSERASSYSIRSGNNSITAPTLNQALRDFMFAYPKFTR